MKGLALRQPYLKDNCPFIEHLELHVRRTVETVAPQARPKNICLSSNRPVRRCQRIFLTSIRSQTKGSNCENGLLKFLNCPALLIESSSLSWLRKGVFPLNVSVTLASLVCGQGQAISLKVTCRGGRSGNCSSVRHRRRCLSSPEQQNTRPQAASCSN